MSDWGDYHDHDTDVLRLRSFLSSFEGTRAQSKKLADHAYPTEAQFALNRFRLKGIERIAKNCTLVGGQPRQITFEEMLGLWAYQLLVTCPCLDENKTHDLIRNLENEPLDEEDLICLFSCIKHDRVLQHAITHNPELAELLDAEDIKILQNTFAHNFEQKPLSKTWLKAIKEILQGVSSISANFTFLWNNPVFLLAMLASPYLQEFRE